MPELPEVETTRLGILPIQQHIIQKIIVRQPRLRWPVPVKKLEKVAGEIILNISRRGKYIILHIPSGKIILHLGMSGHLRLFQGMQPPEKHDHLDILFNHQQCLRLTDPRRFGACLWAENNQLHPLLSSLGIEPLNRKFTALYLQQQFLTKKIAIKLALMDQSLIAGIGNIYANEALFLAGIHPCRKSNSLNIKELKKIVIAIKTVLRQAIKKGGTTLKDFKNTTGKPGYFSQELKIYGREGFPCVQCHTILQAIRIGQRGTVYCPVCQN